MSAATSLVAGGVRLTRRRSFQFGVFIEAPAIMFGGLVFLALQAGSRMQDFAWLRLGALAVAHGRSPYTPPLPALLAQNDKFIYPPADAYLLVPFAALPRAAADVAFLLLSVAAVALALRLLEVRDWRCYGLTLLSPCVFFALSEGTLGPLMLLGLAASWRFRRRTFSLAIIVGLTALAKLFLWPLIVWLLVTRRGKAAGGALIVACGSALISWAAISFDGLRQYPTLLRVLDEVQIPKSYSLAGLAWDLGASDSLGTLILIGVATLGCGLMAYIARSRDDGDALAFMTAVLTAVLATPLLWIHYLVLLLAPVALARRTLSWLWIAPVIFWVHPFLEATPGRIWEPIYLVALTIALGVLMIATRLRGETATGKRQPAVFAH